MQYKLGLPKVICEIGKKSQNEDRISPEVAKMSASVRCFVLCDGMGRHEKGAEAASVVAHSLRSRLLETRTDPDIITRQRFNAALTYAYDRLDEMAYESERRPGTTVACIYMGANGALVAHIGDSRVYHIRPGKGIIYMTEDHSLVRELVRRGEITESEALIHPRRNVITRAMQPGAESRFTADLQLITDIHAGDYFFICSDGMLENITDAKLVDIIGNKVADEQKIELLRAECENRSTDNYTCILIPVNAVIGEVLPTPDTKSPKATPLPVSADLSSAPVKKENHSNREKTEAESVPHDIRNKKTTAVGKTVNQVRRSKKTSLVMTWLLVLFGIAFIAFGIWMFIDSQRSENDDAYDARSLLEERIEHESKNID